MRFLSLLQREFHVLKAQAGLGLQAFAVYALMIALFPFLLGAWPQLLSQIAAPFIWMILLIMILMVMPQLFQRDVEEGGLDFLRTLPISHLQILMAKGVALLLVMGLPFLGITIALSPLYGIDSEVIITLITTLGMSLPLLISLVLFGGILGASSRTSGSFFIIFLILPFTLPLVLLSLYVIENGNFMAYFRLILALNLVMIPLSLGMASYLMRDVLAR